MAAALPITARRALAPLALMALIFYLSAQPDLSSGLGLIDTIGRKVIHMAEYALLTVLWVWALRPSAGSERSLAIAASLALFYAISDEFHQSFVEGRHGTPLDVVIDAAGIAAAAALVRRHEGSTAGTG